MAPTNNSWNSQDPAQVAKGGTGIATTTAYAPICGGTTATGAMQAAATGLGTSGYVLTSNGASALPSFQFNGPQLIFFTNKTATTNNVCGITATVYTIVYDSAVVNVGTCYATATGIFTVPSTGIYMFVAGLSLSGLLTSAHTGMAWAIRKIAGTYNTNFEYRSYAPNNFTEDTINLTACKFMPPLSLTSGDTYDTNIQVYGAADDVDLLGETTDYQTYWACYKVT